MFNRTPDKKAAIGYFFFSGFSTFLAFFLPAHLWTAINRYTITTALPLEATLLIWDLFLVTALYHGKYRLKTTLSDLGLKRADAYGKVIDAVFYFSLLVLLGLHIFIFWALSNLNWGTFNPD